MKSKLLVSTAALALMVSAGAYAQSRSTDTASDRPAAAQSQRDRGASTREMNRTNTRDTDRMRDSQTTGQAPTGGSASPDTKATGDSNADRPAATENNTRQRGNAAQSDQNTRTNTTQDNQPSSSTRSNQASEPRNSGSNTAGQNDRNQPAAAQRDTTTDRQQRSTDSNTEDRNRQSASDTRSSTRASASLQGEQRTRLDQAITKLDARPVSNVNFSVSVGTAVPRSISLQRVPTSIVSILPQYRGYNYFLVRDEVVIVEPRTHKIVDVIERRGSSQASTSIKRERRVSLSETQRRYIREHAAPRRTTTTTTGAAPRRQTIVVGEEVPQSVEIESFPEEVYREVPVVREYRYIRSGDDVYLVDPGSRRVIEELGD